MPKPTIDEFKADMQVVFGKARRWTIIADLMINAGFFGLGFSICKLLGG